MLQQNLLHHQANVAVLDDRESDLTDSDNVNLTCLQSLKTFSSCLSPLFFFFFFFLIIPQHTPIHIHTHTYTH
jgi:hypothetical protein